MSDIASKYFNGVDLARYGLVTSQVGGTLGLAGREVARLFIPGRDEPADRDLRGSLEQVLWHCVVKGDSHSDLVDKLAHLKGLLSPRLGFRELRVPDRWAQRTFARCKGFPVKLDKLPYLSDVVEFDLTFERYPYWEDVIAAAVAVDDLSGSVTNTGQMPCPATYTCWVTAALAGGLSFGAGNATFTYQGALGAGDVLVVTSDLYSDPPDVTLNGVRDFGNTHPDAAFPALAVGANAISKSSADFSLGVTWRRRWE